MKRRSTPSILALGLIILHGCHSEPPAPVSPATTKTYTLRGIVREVDTPSGVVTIAHEDIPGFMKAMTMDFTPIDRSNLGELNVGDEVEGPLVVATKAGTVEDYNLRSLSVVKAAPRALKLDFGSGTATIAEKPAILKVGEPVPDFAMTTQEGKPLTLSDLRGEVVVLTFVYTRCPLPDYCPAMDRRFRAISERLSAVKGRSRGVRLLSISFDPEHDTPEVLRKHAESQGAAPPLWTYAVASHEELAKVAPRLGLIYGPMPGEIRHNLCTAVVGPDGRLARLDVGAAGKSWTPEDMLRTINEQITIHHK